MWPVSVPSLVVAAYNITSLSESVTVSTTASQAGEITGGTGTDLIAGTEEQLKMERKLSLKVEFLRNDRFVRLIAGGVLGAVMLYYSLQIVMFLIPIIYPGYITVKTLQVLKPDTLKVKVEPQV